MGCGDVGSGEEQVTDTATESDKSLTDFCGVPVEIDGGNPTQGLSTVRISALMATDFRFWTLERASADGAMICAQVRLRTSSAIARGMVAVYEGLHTLLACR